MPLVTASESGKGQTELVVRATKDVEFGPVSSLARRSEVRWNAARKRVTAPYEKAGREMAGIRSTVPRIWSRNMGGINT